MRRAALLALVWAFGCAKSPLQASLSAVVPDRGPTSRATAVVISGEHLQAKLVTDFASPNSSVLDATFTASVGKTPLSDVALQSDGTLSATVPAGLAPGTFDVVVTTPQGQTVSLPGAYRVLTPGELGELVASYRFDPIVAQLVGVPFRVKVTAIDAAGVAVQEFSGQTQLTDLTGTGVPRAIGPFARGTWDGLVEVRAARADDVLTVTDDRGRTGTSNPFAVGAGPANRLSFSTPPRSTVVGECSQEISVQLVDATGTPSVAGAALPVAVSASPPTGFALYADPACTSPLAVFSIAPGASSTSFYARGTRAGAVQLKATAAGVSSATQTEQLVAGPPTRLVFTTPEPTLNAGNCSSDVGLQTRDAFDNPAPVAAAVTVSVTPEAGSNLTVYDAGACAVTASTVGLAAGQKDASFRLQGTTAGAYQVTVSAPGLTSAMQLVRVNPQGFPTQLVIVSQPQTVVVATCSGALAVQSQDSLGNVSDNPGSFGVSLAAAPAAGFQFFSDPACATPVSSLALGGGKTTGVVYFKGTQAGAVTVTASAGGLQPGVQTQTLVAGPGSALTFVSPPQTLVAGACSAEVVVGLLDGLGNPAVAAAAVPLSVTGAPPAGVTFYSDAACTVMSGAVEITAGQPTTRLFLRGTLVGTLTVNATSPGFAPAAQAETIGAGSPAALQFLSASQSIAAGSCSSPVTVQTVDSFGNPANLTAAASVAFTAAPVAGLTFYADPSCATPASAAPVAALGHQAVIFFRSTVPGPVVVSAALPGLVGANQTETVTAGAPFALAFATPARTAVAGACSAVVTVQVRDALGNAAPVVAATVVSLAAVPVAGFTLYADAACATTVTQVTVGAGSSSASFYFRGTLAGAVALTASSAPLGPASQSQTVSAAAADRLAWVTAAQTVGAGACSALAVLARRDPFGNDAPGAAAAPVTLSAMPAAGFGFFSDAACTSPIASVSIAAGAATAQLYFRGTTQGTVTMTASAPGLTPASQVATISAAATPTQLVFTTPARTVSAGACSAILSVQARDSFNNPRSVAASTLVGLAAAPAAGFTFYSDAACGAAVTGVTMLAGTDTVSFYVRGSTAGAVGLTASAPGLTAAVQTVTVQAGAPDRLVFTTPVQTLQAGACSAVATVQSRDPFGNVAPVASAAAVALSSGAGVTFYSDAGCVTAVASVSLAVGSSTQSFYFKGTVPGARTLTAQAPGLTAASQGATINPGAPTQLAFTTPARTVAAGACSAVLTVQTRDAFANPAPVATNTTVSLTAAPPAGFTFYSDAACATAVAQVTVLTGASSADLYVRSSAVGSVTVTAQSPGVTQATQPVTVTAAPPTQLVFTTAPQTIQAGSCSALLTVQLRDGFNNPVNSTGATVVNLSAAPATGFAFDSDAACATGISQVTIPNGASSASFYVRGTLAGTVTVTAASGALTSAVQPVVVNPGPETTFSWDVVASPRPIGVAFGVTIRARDAFGNLATSYTGTANLNLVPSGSVSCTSSCSNMNKTGAFAAGVWSGTVTLGGAAGTNRQLEARQGADSGLSNLFDVVVPAPRSPPRAKLTASSVVVTFGQMVNFDASLSSDYQTATGALQVSWDLYGQANAAQLPPGNPWSAWSTTKTTSATYFIPGTYQARVAVRDADGDIGYARLLITVFLVGGQRCIVTTNADVDDGATACAGPYGTDGKLSLSEAVRLSNASMTTETITFSGPMTISGTGEWLLTRSVNISAVPGVIFFGKRLHVGADNLDVTVQNVEFTGQTQPLLADRTGGTLTLRGVSLHDMPGVQTTGVNLTIEDSQLSACTGPCVEKVGAAAALVKLAFSEVANSPTQAGVLLSGCPGASQAVDVSSSTFTSVLYGVRALCDGRLAIRNNTFHQVGTAVAYQGGTGHELVNNVISSSTLAASCGTATFMTRAYHLLFGNGGNGCLGADANLLAVDPLYAFAANGDLRLSFASPAKDSASNLGLDLTLPLAANFLGAGPDRGGKETY